MTSDDSGHAQAAAEEWQSLQRERMGVCAVRGRELHGSALHDVYSSNQMAGTVGQPRFSPHYLFT